MKLSEAIRLGAMATPQAFGTFDDGKGGTCALGAAVKAAGIVPVSEADPGFTPGTPTRPLSAGPRVQYSVPMHWPTMFVKVCPEPGCGKLLVVAQLIPHLNDVHVWTREQIADWVETFEPEQPVETAKPTPVEEEVPVRLSEAIRLGSMMVPQSRSRYYAYEYDGDREKVVAACALGAAGLALGMTVLDIEIALWPPEISRLLERGDIECPCCRGGGLVSLGNVIVHLNDGHRWTRERIADWVARFETETSDGAVPADAGAAGESVPVGAAARG